MIYLAFCQALRQRLTTEIVVPSVCLSVCVSVKRVSCAQTVDLCQLVHQGPGSAGKMIAKIFATVFEFFLQLACLRPNVHAQCYYFYSVRLVNLMALIIAPSCHDMSSEHAR